jgi:uncharacterized membrane protein (UPF0127 family)
MQIKIFFKKNKFHLEVKRVSFFGRLFGLMFKSKNTSNLLFDFFRDRREAIHSFFVFFDFLVLWLDEKNKVLGYRKVRPFSPHIKPKFKFRKIVEIPLNDGNKRIVRLFEKVS